MYVAVSQGVSLGLRSPYNIGAKIAGNTADKLLVIANGVALGMLVVSVGIHMGRQKNV
jgi:hypothetical protein